MRYTLMLGSKELVEFGGTVTVGRQGGWVDVVIGDSEHENSAHVSRRHARLTAALDGVVVEDMGSHNGTYINGHRVEGKGLACPGDEIGFSLGVRVTVVGVMEMSSAA